MAKVYAVHASRRIHEKGQNRRILEALAQQYWGFRRNTDGIPLDFNALFRYTKEVSGDDTPQILPMKEPETAMKIMP